MSARWGTAFLAAAGMVLTAPFVRAQPQGQTNGPLPSLPSPSATTPDGEPPPLPPLPPASEAAAPEGNEVPVVPAAPPAYPYVAPPETTIPPAHRGFQLVLRTGLSLPYGHAESGRALSSIDGASVPFVLEVGGKPSPFLFLGAYFGLGFGWVSDAYAPCQVVASDCFLLSLTVGFEAQVHLAPGARWDPWLGYGVGVEVTGPGGERVETAYGGIEFARLSFGVDARINRVAAIGPYVEATLGNYNTVNTDDGYAKTQRDPVGSTLHGFFTIGPRITFFP